MKKEEILEEIGKDDLESIVEGITDAEEAIEISKENYEQSEQLVREEIAKVLQSYKKDGTTLDLSVAPKALVKSALVVKTTGENKLRAKLDTQDEIVDMMENGNVPKEIVESYYQKMMLKKETEDQSKDAIENLKTMYPAEIVDAVKLVVKKKIEEEKEDTEDDENPKKPKKTKNTEEILETVKSILQILNER